MMTNSSLGYPAKYNSIEYPLSVITNNNDESFPAGIALFSTADVSIPNDELNLYADINGKTKFSFSGNDVEFNTRTQSSPMSYMGFDAGSRSVQVRDDFASNNTQPGSSYAKLYVEAKENGFSPQHDIAVWGNNSNVTGATFIPVGVRGDATASGGPVGVNIGVGGNADNEVENRGVYGASEVNGNTGGSNIISVIMTTNNPDLTTRATSVYVRPET